MHMGRPLPLLLLLCVAVNERPRSWSKLVRYESSPERDAEQISREDSWNAAPHVGSKGNSAAWRQAAPNSLVESRYASIRQIMNDETERNTALAVPSSAPAGLDTVSATVNSMLEVGTRPDSPGYLREASLRTTAAALRTGPAANPSHRPVASVAVDDPNAWWNKIIDKYAYQVQEQDNAALAALSYVYGEHAVQIGEQIGRERAGQRAEEIARARAARDVWSAAQPASPR